MMLVSGMPRPNNSFHRARAGGQVLQSHIVAMQDATPSTAPVNVSSPTLDLYA